MAPILRLSGGDRGIELALLLGTRTTLEAEMYPREFADAGIRVVLPGDDDREFLDHTISNELALGHASAGARRTALSLGPSSSHGRRLVTA